MTKILLLIACLAGAANAVASGQAVPPELAKPQGKNCDLTSPPPNSGEQGGSDVTLQVWPRLKDMDDNYTGCQAVFATTAEASGHLVWLLEIVNGEPLRKWSPDPSVTRYSECAYKNGALTRGTMLTCAPQRELFMRSKPAGCYTSARPTQQCDDDGA
jgi:hypothetical protein